MSLFGITAFIVSMLLQHIACSDAGEVGAEAVALRGAAAGSDVVSEAKADSLEQASFTQDPPCVSSGDKIFLRAHTGMVLTVENDTVHAMWNDTGVWQELTLEKEGGGAVMSGDDIFLTAHSGMRLTVALEHVHFKWDDRGSWQQLEIVKADWTDGAVCSGDTVYLRAHNGKTLTVQDTEVHAKWDHTDVWERFVVEMASSATR